MALMDLLENVSPIGPRVFSETYALYEYCLENDEPLFCQK